MDVKSLKGIAVVTIEGGEKVGSVDEMIFNLERKQLIAFRLSRTGFFRGEQSVVAMTDVQHIGTDAIMIRDRSSVRDEKSEREFADRPDLGDLMSLRVVTEHGGYLGTLSNVEIDPDTGALAQLHIASGALMSVLGRSLAVPAAEVVSMGTDVIVVPNKYGADAEETGESPDDERPEVIQ